MPPPDRGPVVHVLPGETVHVGDFTIDPFDGNYPVVGFTHDDAAVAAAVAACPDTALGPTLFREGRRPHAAPLPAPRSFGPASLADSAPAS